nr:uncharacterized protein LOC112039016 [Quercus suber]
MAGRSKLASSPFSPPPTSSCMRYLTALQDLRVCNSEVADLSNDWDEMEWQGLRTLLSLQLSSLPKLASLPMGLQYVSSLQNLEISFSPSLKSQMHNQMKKQRNLHL